LEFHPRLQGKSVKSMRQVYISQL
jgi:CBS domain-containing protein